MTRRFPSRLLGLVAAALLVSTPASAQEKKPDKIDLSGKWTFTVQTDAGTGTPAVTLKQNADTLTGHYSSQAFGEVDFKGTIKERKLTFTFTADIQGTSLTVTYTGTVEADGTLKGTVDLGGMGSGTFTGKKG